MLESSAGHLQRIIAILVSQISIVTVPVTARLWMTPGILLVTHPRHGQAGYSLMGPRVLQRMKGTPQIANTDVGILCWCTQLVIEQSQRPRYLSV